MWMIRARTVVEDSPTLILGTGHPDPSAKGTQIVVWRKKHREQIAKQRGCGLSLPGHGPNKIMRTAQRCQALRQLASHVGRGRG